MAAVAVNSELGGASAPELGGSKAGMEVDGCVRVSDVLHA